MQRFGKADLVVANNVFAHIENINGVTEAINRILKEDGVFVFEVHYLGKIVQGLQYDMIYHEHLFYYSLLALQNHFARDDMTDFHATASVHFANRDRIYASVLCFWGIAARLRRHRTILC